MGEMNQQEPALSLRVDRRNGTWSISVQIGDRVVFCDTGNVLRSTERARILNALKAALPGLTETSMAEIEGELLQAGSKTTDADDGENGSPSKADRAVRYVRECATLFHDAEGEVFADVDEGDGVRKTLRVGTTAFRRWLDGRFYAAEAGALSAAARADAEAVVSAMGNHSGPQREVHLRTAYLSDRIFIDLGDESWRVVLIDGDGWRVIDAPEDVRFRRERGMQPLPVPVDGGDVEELRRFLPATDDPEQDRRDFVLTTAWILSALSGVHPHPLAVLQGEQGSGKSTRSRLLRELTDPNSAPLRSQPRSEQDLFITARNSAVIGLDNLSSIPEWLSDALCRLTSGGSFSTRTLYTNNEESTISAARPVLVNGISDLVARPDLASRAVVFRLPRLDRVENEVSFWERFEEARPRLLGALLEGLASFLRNKETQVLTDLPRLADFASLIHGASPGLGWEESEFIGHYREAIRQLTREELAIEPVAVALLRLLEAPLEAPARYAGFTRLADGSLEARPGDWHAALSGRNGADDKRTWPANPRALSDRLRRLAPALRTVGVDVTWPPRSATRRTIRVRRIPDPAPSALVSIGDADDARPADDAVTVVTQDLLPVHLGGGPDPVADCLGEHLASSPPPLVESTDSASFASPRHPEELSEGKSARCDADDAGSASVSPGFERIASRLGADEAEKLEALRAEGLAKELPARVADLLDARQDAVAVAEIERNYQAAIRCESPAGQPDLPTSAVIAETNKRRR